MALVVLQAVSFSSDCPEEAVCGIVLDLVVSGIVLFPYQYPAYTNQLANTAQCAFTSSLFQVCSQLRGLTCKL